MKADTSEFNDELRALRRQHQPTLEGLFDGARQYADVADYTTHLDRDTLFLVSICHAQKLRIAELKKRMEDIEAQLGWK